MSIVLISKGILGFTGPGSILASFGISEIQVAADPFPPYISDFPKQRPAASSWTGLAMDSLKNHETVVHSLQDLGRLVRTQRRASGLRIDDTASLCGVSVDLLSRLENGQSGVSSQRLLKVLDGLGLAMLIVPKGQATKLLGRTGSMNKEDPSSP